jgi:hypothetical protein
MTEEPARCLHLENDAYVISNQTSKEERRYNWLWAGETGTPRALIDRGKFARDDRGMGRERVVSS